MNPTLQSGLLVFWESLAYLIVFDATFLKRTQYNKYLIWICTILLICLTNTGISIVVGQGVLKGFLVVLANLTISAMLFRASTFVRFYIVTFVYVLLVTADAFSIILYAYCDKVGFWTNVTPCVTTFYWFIPKMVVVLIILILRKWFFTENIVKLQNRTPVFFSVVLMLVNVLIVIDLSTNPLAHSAATLLSTSSLIVMDLLLYYFMKLSYRQAKEEYHNILLRKQIEYQKMHSHEVSSLYNQQKSFMHDYRNQVTTVKHLLTIGKYDEATKYVGGLSSELITQHYEFHTGHDILDAIINIKSTEAKVCGIDFSVNTNNLSEVKVKDIDIVCIMTNLLDNAIEACKKCDLDNRQICIKLEDKKQKITISIKNSISEKPILRNHIPQTTKLDATSHGIGFLSITSALEKYGVDFEIFVDDWSFHFITIIKYAF